MTETPKCPYCGAETRLNENNEGIYWYECRECNATGPTEKTPVEAFFTALHRAEPEMQPLTLEELKAHCAKGRDAEPLWVEFDTVSDMALWVLANTPYGMDEKDIPSLAYWLRDEELVFEYGKFWCCWPRKPTPEQMAAEKWED